MAPPVDRLGSADIQRLSDSAMVITQMGLEYGSYGPTGRYTVRLLDGIFQRCEFRYIGSMSWQACCCAERQQRIPEPGGRDFLRWKQTGTQLVAEFRNCDFGVRAHVGLV